MSTPLVISSPRPLWSTLYPVPSAHASCLCSLTRLWLEPHGGEASPYPATGTPYPVPCTRRPVPSAHASSVRAPWRGSRDLERGEYTSILALLRVVDKAAQWTSGADPAAQTDDEPSSVSPRWKACSASTAADATHESVGTPELPTIRPHVYTGRRKRSMRMSRATADIRYASLGQLAKLLADGCAQDCAHTQHLVGAIAKCTRNADAAQQDPQQG